MSVKVEFLINSKLEIEYNDDSYKSNIQDITDEYLGISIPVSDGKYLPLARGEKVTAVYYYGKDIFRFDTVVIGRKVEKILIIMLKKPEKVTMVQRRNFARVPLMINVYCALICNEKNIYTIGDNQIEFFDAYSLDISGGGMRVAIDRKYENKIQRGNMLMVTIPLGNENVTIQGKIVRVENDRKNPKIICGLNFIDLDRKVRETIIKMVFNTMRDQMKKGAREE
ncbi:flagellar brake protein [Clostridium magnum]|uniref:Flagellar brake protein YcgR n=1 Tax=Clostridium magnum DSM 2767 TaxID=1121326 RepID=A0A162UPP3_9CLOT|nr:flagellar brake domain-containing protein [Clostridium magnum]KZL94154.1 flagellar brake protein YcgR [Clostridium magnum DSM 2767]SHH94074.1 c-di-GMP-binding flagellar brake protein YcgR, contains PilZNR and PilZ domains [Clostridium magnum DSM 2767]